MALKVEPRDRLGDAHAVDIILVDDLVRAVGEQARAPLVRNLPAHHDDGTGVARAAQKRDGLQRVGGRFEDIVEEDEGGLARDDAVNGVAEGGCTARIRK